jgi:hypothetical protein
MEWTAPQVTRRDDPAAVGERAMLEGWLDYHRDTLLWKCQGLTADQLRRRSVPPSALSLLGLVRHMTEVERWWFRRRFAGEDVPGLFWTEERPDGDFDDVDLADPAADLAGFVAEVEHARRVVEGRALDDTFGDPAGGRPDPGRVLSLRWVYCHMIEEYARHNGHADLLRERIDGVTGD